MKHVKIVLAVFISLFSFSCAFVSFEKFNLECNLSENLEFFEEENITLNFSILPNHQDIENNIKLVADSSTTECVFTWNGNNCSFAPKTGWEYGSFYDFTLSNQIEMEDGRTYKVNIRRMFYYGNESKYLKLVNCNVEHDSQIEKNDSLEFTFNNPVNILSFKENFSIIPVISYDIKFEDDNKKVCITPSETWKTNTYYTWNLTDIKSNEKYPLDKTYSQGFYAPQDTVQPQVSLICPVAKEGSSYTWFTNKTLDQMQVDYNIGIVFSEPVDFDSLNNALSFSPNMEGYLLDVSEQAEEKGTKFIYCVQNYWNANKEYEMTISKSLKDLNDISLYDDYVVYFTTDPAYFQIEKITINQTDVTVFNEDINQISLAAGESIIPVTIYYNKAVTAEYKNKAYESVSLNSYFPSTAISPTVLSAKWTDDSTLTINFQGFTKTTTEVTNYYLLNISGGSNILLDEYGNYLEDNVCVYFIVQ